MRVLLRNRTARSSPHVCKKAPRLDLRGEVTKVLAIPRGSGLSVLTQGSATARPGDSEAGRSTNPAAIISNASTMTISPTRRSKTFIPNVPRMARIGVPNAKTMKVMMTFADSAIKTVSESLSLAEMMIVDMKPDPRIIGIANGNISDKYAALVLAARVAAVADGLAAPLVTCVMAAPAGEASAFFEPA